MINSAFRQCRDKNEAALITYFPGGYPDLDTSLDIIKSMADAGADILEIGVPFSDPVADGPVIQAAAQKALEQGISLKRLLEGLSEYDMGKPVLLMSYLNPLIAYGETLMADARSASVSGFIIPDLPVDEAAFFSDKATEQSLDLILLAAPTSSEKRLTAIAKNSRGFIYTVSRTGITGQGGAGIENVKPLVRSLKSKTDTAVAVGFGVDGPEAAGAIAGFADGVIVGTRLIRAFDAGEDVAALVRELKDATLRRSAQ
ncbi:tryptophan synthase subunit alpha [bacterium]|nr:tryptophan synthase subunit alpha [bacterium]